MNTKPFLIITLITAAALLCGCLDRGNNPLGQTGPGEDTLFTPTGDVYITEVCPSNSDMVLDEDGDDPDWIELYNSGAAAINLKGYSLSDDTNNLALWQFDSAVIEPKSYLLVFASGKDRPKATAGISDDSIKTFAFSKWSDSMGSGGRSSIFPHEFSSIAPNDSTGHRIVSATFNLVDNRPELAWSSVNVTLSFDRQHDSLGSDYSMYRTLDLVVTLPEDKSLAIRFTMQSIEEWKGPLHIITGTGKTDDHYLIPLRQGKGGLDLKEVTGIRIESPQYDFGTVKFTLRRITLLAKKGNLHTSFKLSGDEPGCFLSDPDGNLCDRVPLSPLPLNRTQGRCDGKWLILAEATPGAENTATGFRRITAAPVIGNGGGFYKSPVKVSLDAPAGATVFYTLDGSVPTPETARRYEAPVEIASTCVLRYMAAGDSAGASDVSTESYFIGETVHLPVIALSTDSALLFDPDTGLYMKGPGAQDSFPYFGANFWDDKEIPVHCELFETDGNRSFSIDAGLSIAGNWSRGSPKKSLQINFREAYGTSELKAVPFPRFPELTKFKKLILRNNGGGRNCAIINNTMLTSLIDNRDIDYQKNRPVVVYINGRYFGIHHLMEPSNHDYVYTEYDLKKEEIDFYDYNEEIKWGTPANWQRLLKLLQLLEAADSAAGQCDSIYESIRREMDTDNFIDYHAFEIYIGNTDWPANNNRRWRALDDKGRWRWLIYDLDAAFGGFGTVDDGELVSYNTLAFALDATQPEDDFPNGAGFTFPLRALLHHRSFREDFINRFATLLATNFAPQRVKDSIDRYADEISDEVPADYKRWDMDTKYWQENIGKLKEYAADRVSYMYRYIGEQFDCDTTFTLTIDAPPAAVKVNGMPLLQEGFSGTYFTAVPVTLSSKTPVKDWGDGNSDNPRRISGSGTVSLKPVFD